MLTPDTFSCLVLEMWASEIRPGRSNNIEQIFPRNRHARCGSSLIQLLKENQNREALYRTCNLLADACELDQFPSRNLTFESRPADGSAVAARHWYSTATAFVSADDPANWIPVPLPGRFTTRGDWFLAMAKASRSVRLGERAIDLLSTRRGNIVRLQEGLGLPVRDVADEEDSRELWTPLRWFDEDLNLQRRAAMYKQVREMGDTGEGKKGRLRWLWRSSIRDYDRHVRIWQRWLCRTIESHGTWANDKKEFHTRCVGLIDTLKRATPSKPN